MAKNLTQKTIRFITRIHLPEAAAASFRIDAVEKSVARAGGAVKVLTSALPKNKAGHDDEGTVRVPVLRDKDGYLKGYIPYLTFDLQAGARALFGKRPDLAVVEPPPTTGMVIRIASALRRFPYVWYAADVWSDAAEATGAPGFVVSAVRFMESATIRGAAGVIAVSEGVGERVKALGGTNIRVIPNGADTDTFNPGAKMSEEELAAFGITRPFVVYAGTASEWQGAEIFAEAFARANEEEDLGLQLVVVGRGDSLEIMREIGKSMPERDYEPMIIRDPVDPATAAGLQASARAALVSIRPGLGYDFAYPTKVLTALACGTPVLYAGAGPAREDLRNHEIGVACGYDVEQIAVALTEIAEKEPEPSLRERARTWVEENKSMRAMGDAAAEFFAHILQS